MKYYKIILDSEIIGVSTSANCLRFQQKHSMLSHTTEEQAEYVECMQKLYHASWMQPIKTNLYAYIIASVIAIEEQEYSILAPAIADGPIHVEESNEEEIPVIDSTNPIDEITFEFVRAAKINEMSRICGETIEAGFDLAMRGAIHHFSLTTQDQLNLMSLGTMAQTSNEIPYHADGEEVIFYTSDEINQIIAAANTFKTYQTTYYNSLKAYINSLETIEEISAIEYGIEIPEKFKTEVLKALEHK